MSEVVHFLYHIQNAFRENWTAPAMTVYRGATLTYGEAAVQITRLQLLLRQMGLVAGDKVALCGANSPEWAIAFLAICGYQAVAVPILNDFTPDSIVHITRHSDAKFLFVSKSNWNKLPAGSLDELSGIMVLESQQLVHSAAQPSLVGNLEQLQQIFDTKYPEFGPQEFVLQQGSLDDLAVINYTSGTTSAPKGVMLSARNISSNITYALDNMGHGRDWHLLSMLPLAHMYGMTFEFLFQMAGGCHIYFLGKTPSPNVLISAMAEVKPYLIITVPLVIEKIIRKNIFPKIETTKMKLLLHTPIVNRFIYKKIREQFISIFGGGLWEFIIGGAALNPEVERFLRNIRFPYTIGFGMTECAPILGYAPHQSFVRGSCGRVVDRMELAIDSDDPQRTVGEILAKGDNVMMGYYKNPEATAAALDKNGWLHTGDLGLMDKGGNLFIKGRCKNMILGPSGQNIYPEEIEDKINSVPIVLESLVVERNGRLTAIIVPDFDQAHAEGLNDEQVQQQIMDLKGTLNKSLPSYSQLYAVEIRKEEFEKTPKRSIRRFLYK